MRSGARFIAVLGLGAAVLLGAATEAAAARLGPPVADKNDPLAPYLRFAKFRDVQLSPTGEYIAVSMMEAEDSGVLVFIRLADKKITGSVKTTGQSFVTSIRWVNDERVIYTIAESFGSKAAAVGTGELYAANWDGSKATLLAGGRDAGRLAQIRASLPSGKFEDIAVIDTLRNDDKFILINRRPPDAVHYTAERLDVYSANSLVRARAPVSNADFFSDQQGRIRAVSGFEDDRRQKLFARKDDDSEWTLINDEHDSHLRLQVVGFSADGTTMYVDAEHAEGPDSIDAIAVDGGKRTTLLRDARADPLDLLWDHDHKRIVAARFSDGHPKWTLIDDSAPEAQGLAALVAAAPGEFAYPTSYSKDGSAMVFAVRSDVSPPRYYLMKGTGKPELVLSERDWINPDDMAEMKPFEMKARDGLSLQGYLTLPPGGKDKNLPMVVLPHGGPFGIADHWEFDEDVQLLAHAGYAVLQVNFRGSGERGKAFVEAGAKEWGGKMQDDLTDVTRWAIDEGIADKDRVCIYGASYGAYAAAMGVAKEPDLYRCAVGYVGLYDLDLDYNYGGARSARMSVGYMKEWMGSGDELKGRSPAKLVDQIKAPIFLAAGGQDRVCPPVQSERFRDALKKAGKTVEYMSAEQEAHGYYRENNKREFYTRLLAFLDRYIGPASVK